MTTPVGELGRRLELRGSFNFRDLGGYVTEDGRTVRWRRLFRADGLHRLDDRDLTELGELGLRTVIDLRTTTEVDERGRCPDGVGDGIVYHHLPMFDVLPTQQEVPEWVDVEFVADRYRRMLDEGAGAIRQALEILSDVGAYPAVFHCAAGKDRTGVFAAVVLGTLGVADEVIVSDYALTQEAIDPMIARMKLDYPDAAERLDGLRAGVMAADPASMAGMLERVTRDFGSMVDYVCELGMERSIPYLRAALLEP